MDEIKIKAFAKINLGLEVLYKRADGYHEINTVFTLTDLCDNLTISLAEGLSAECYPALEINPKDNLVIKAAKLLQKKYDAVSYGAKITIYKNIPIGAGLGGGSSDAAAALVGLCRLWNIKYDISDLLEIAGQIGSDVPYFIRIYLDELSRKQSAVASGRGEILNYFDYHLNMPYLLIYPNIHVSTVLAYKSLKKDSRIIIGTDMLRIIMEEPVEHWKNYLVNDFEKSVFKDYPVIGEIKSKLYETGAEFAMLSGSGSCIYGIFKDIESLNKTKNLFENYRTITGNISY